MTDREPSAPSLEGRRFVAESNSAGGQVGEGTVFEYHERDGVVWADYRGGAVVLGRLIGTRRGDRLEFRYVHLDADGATASGRCASTIEAGERLRLHETWAWESRPGEGTSVLVELGEPAVGRGCIAE